jgi:hypothetical protein
VLETLPEEKLGDAVVVASAVARLWTVVVAVCLAAFAAEGWADSIASPPPTTAVKPAAPAAVSAVAFLVKRRPASLLSMLMVVAPFRRSSG